MSTHALASKPPVAAPGGSSEHACLSVVHHPDPAMIGRCVLVPEGGELLLGRGADALGPDTLRDDRLSRRHVQLSREGRGVVVEDQASRNGTTINGRRAGVAQLRQGDVLGIGRLLLLFHWIPEGFKPSAHPRVAGEGPALSRALEQAVRLSEGSAPVLIRGEVGTGRRHLAYEVHRASRKGSPYGVLDCANGAEPPWERICRRVGGGTLVLSDFDQAPLRFQKTVLDAIADPATPFRVVTTLSVAPSVAAREGRLLAQLEDMLNREHAHLPPLRHRPEDVMPLVRHFAREFAGAPRHVSRRLTLMLLLLRWPGNAADVKDTVKRLIAEQKARMILRAPTWLADRVTQSS